MIKIAYICDRKKKCSCYGSCWNTCFHTQDEFHAANGICHSMQELTESGRFVKVGEFDETAYWMETDD